jgi:hypothetical protein
MLFMVDAVLKSGSQVCKSESTCSEVDLNSNIWLAQLRGSCTAHALLIVLVIDGAHG